MSEDSLLQAYLEIEQDWPLSLVSIDAQKQDPMFTSIHLFVKYFPEKTHEDFLAWRHHRTFNDWQNDIYSMSDTEFQHHWPLIAGALAEVKSSG
jgi:hypothetical protein